MLGAADDLLYTRASVSASVPDANSSAALLSLGIAGVAFVRRKME